MADTKKKDASKFALVRSIMYECVSEARPWAQGAHELKATGWPSGRLKIALKAPGGTNERGGSLMMMMVRLMSPGKRILGNGDTRGRWRKQLLSS